VATGYIREVVKELDRQRRQIERAIAALRAIEQESPRKSLSKAKKIDKLTPRYAVEKKNGTTGQVIPFIRPN
jgi:hypothetical protein